MNIFDYIEDGSVQGEKACWSARSPYQPRGDFDLMLVPRVPGWEEDAASRQALERIEAEPWVERIGGDGKEVLLRLDDGWIAGRGAELEAGEGMSGTDRDLAEGRRYAVYFWGANTTKALHIGHLRNLAVGHAIGAAMEQAGARVERRSLICDVGRSMGEAMAGVVHSGRDAQVWPEGEEKSDHFVGACYADYVTAGRAAGIVGGRDADDGAEDSVARESSLYNDKADELMLRVLSGDQEALELWSKTRAWVISGQRKTLARLGIAFDKVIFESDFLPEVLELTNKGLEAGTLTKRYGDDMVMYETEREELEEMPLVRADGLPTQHMRALAYWAAAPELDDFISLQVCGNEWVAHVTCRRQLIDALGVVNGNGNGNGSAKGGGPPTYDVFHGMVARDKASITSSKEGALLVDDLAEWVEREIEADPEMAELRRHHPEADRLPARIALAYFLLQPTSKRVDFEPEKLLRGKGSLGWDLARAQAHAATGEAVSGPAAGDPDYRFAVVQSELHRRHLRSSVESLDVIPMARYISHFARWYAEGERSPEVERVARTVMDQGVRSLGLEGA
jgi:arginyl-tRNA synthetase